VCRFNRLVALNSRCARIQVVPLARHGSCPWALELVDELLEAFEGGVGMGEGVGDIGVTAFGVGLLARHGGYLGPSSWSMSCWRRSKVTSA
jgi:hypothetical protein